GEHSIASGPGPSLHVGARRHLHAARFEARTESSRDGRNHLGFRLRFEAQAVIDVDRGDLASRRASKHHQCERIGTAGHRARDRRSSRRETTALEELS
ncbi:MAG: hypothetical protein QOC92_1087, partial [Acidimicrobiaceae bacterium]